MRAGRCDVAVTKKGSRAVVRVCISVAAEELAVGGCQHTHTTHSVRICLSTTHKDNSHRRHDKTTVSLLQPRSLARGRCRSHARRPFWPSPGLSTWLAAVRVRKALLAFVHTGFALAHCRLVTPNSLCVVCFARLLRCAASGCRCCVRVVRGREDFKIDCKNRSVDQSTDKFEK